MKLKWRVPGQNRKPGMLCKRTGTWQN